MGILEVKFRRQPGAAFEGLPGTVLRLSYRSDIDGRADWALVLPPADDNQGWICCIHGHGSSGDQLYTRADLRKRMLPEFLARGYGILTPNLRGNAWMGPRAARDLHDLLEVMTREFGADRFIFASGSMGGTSNLIYAVLHPEQAAGIVARGAAADLGSYYHWCRKWQPRRPILREIADAIEAAYGGTPSARPELYEAHSALARARRLVMPVFLAHGAADRTIPVEQSRRLADRLSARATCRYVEIPDGNHDAPLFLRASPHPLDWIAENAKKKR